MNENAVHPPRVQTVIEVIAAARARRLQAVQSPPSPEDVAKEAAPLLPRSAEQEVAGGTNTRNRQP